MYDYNNEYAGRDHHQELLKEAAADRRARSVANNTNENIVEKLGALVNKAVESVTNAANADRKQTNIEASK